MLHIGADLFHLSIVASARDTKTRGEPVHSDLLFEWGVDLRITAHPTRDRLEGSTWFVNMMLTPTRVCSLHGKRLQHPLACPKSRCSEGHETSLQHDGVLQCSVQEVVETYFGNTLDKVCPARLEIETPSS